MNAHGNPFPHTDSRSPNPRADSGGDQSPTYPNALSSRSRWVAKGRASTTGWAQGRRLIGDPLPVGPGHRVVPRAGMRASAPGVHRPPDRHGVGFVQVCCPHRQVGRNPRDPCWGQPRPVDDEVAVGSRTRTRAPAAGTSSTSLAAAIIRTNNPSGSARPATAAERTAARTSRASCRADPGSAPSMRVSQMVVQL